MLNKNDLLSLEQYTKQRTDFRKEVIETRKTRAVALGDHMRLLFENKKTIQYQIQEMLRIEKIFEDTEIQEELDAYNPLIPTGTNLKATMMLEYSDEVERKQALAKLVDIEKKIYFQVGEHHKVFAICNEDLERQTEDKTSSVHFMRFEFNDSIKQDFIKLPVKLISDHPNYQHSIELSQQQKSVLAVDFRKL